MERIDKQKVQEYAVDVLGLKGWIEITWEAEARYAQIGTQKLDDWIDRYPIGYHTMWTKKGDDPDPQVVGHTIKLAPSQSDELVLKALRHELAHAEQAERDGFAKFSDDRLREAAADVDDTEESYRRRPQEAWANRRMNAEWEQLAHCLR